MSEYKGQNGRYRHEQTRISPELQRDIDATRLVTKACGKNVSSLLASRAAGYPASARPHREVSDVDYCDAAVPEQVNAVGRKEICHYIGRELGTVVIDGRRRTVYECNAAAQLRSLNLLRQPPREASEERKPSAQEGPTTKTFWQRLTGG